MKLITICILFVLIIPFTSCKKNDNTAAPENSILQKIQNTSWRLQSFHADSIQVDSIPSGHIYSIQFSDSTVASGRNDCNTYYISYQVSSSGDISFSGYGATKILCPEPTIDSEFKSALLEVNRVSISGNQLKLQNTEQTKILVFVKVQ